MKIRSVLLAGLAIAGIAATSAMSDGHANKAATAAVKARQAVMQLRSFNLGLLGAMAKGEVEYNAEAAASAANDLVTLNALNAGAMWVPGSDNETLGDVTRALPAIWNDGGGIGAKGRAYGEAVTALAAAAGSGLDGLRGAIGPVGAACGSCHETYRSK